MSQTPESIIAYQSRLKHIIDEEARLADVKYHATQEGLEKGLQEGKKEEKIETAKKLIAKGFSNEEIQEITDLSLEAIQHVRDHHEK